MTSIVVPIHTRWGDMDIFAHINNVAYVRYLEDARTHFLAQLPERPVSHTRHRRHDQFVLELMRPDVHGVRVFREDAILFPRLQSAREKSLIF